MSDINRQAMSEIQKWKKQVEGTDGESTSPGYLEQMLSKSMECYNVVNEYGYFFNGDDEGAEDQQSKV
jgi:hypothetical protein